MDKAKRFPLHNIVKIAVIFLLIVSMVENVPLEARASVSEGVRLGQLLEQFLNEGDLVKMDELFSDKVLLINQQETLINAQDDSIDKGYYTPGGYDINQPYTFSFKIFSGKEEVNSYFASLVSKGFQTSASYIWQDETQTKNEADWLVLANLSGSISELDFKLHFDNGKIQYISVDTFI